MVSNHSRLLRRTCVFACYIVLLVSALALSQQQFPAGQNWTNYVRIGAFSLNHGDAAQIVEKATANHVFGIEVDNDITGRYESFLDPTEKLKVIQSVAEQAHRAGNRAFVYIAGTECITANGDKTPHTMAKDHPDWLQRKVTGEPAIFGGGTAFWIRKGDEDVWISPYAAEWRKIYMERVRQIAGTGIDGIYIDIPYWMTHFEGWEDSWASFDDATVAEFRKRTGLDARHDVKIGDFSDPHFRQWVDFRIETITDFLQDIDHNAKSVNPEIKTIPEIYPGIEEEATRVGSDVYHLYPVVDAIAHEYEFGNGDHMASGRTPLDWFRYQVGMHSFRAFAAGKATWILNYSWDGDKKVDARPAMQNLAMSQIMTGSNFWDAPGHSMAGSNNLDTRTKIFSWIEKHQETFYRPRSPINPVGVYFSPKTRDYHGADFISSYRGCLILLMQKHSEFQVVTPRTLADFKGDSLILPESARCPTPSAPPSSPCPPPERRSSSPAKIHPASPPETTSPSSPTAPAANTRSLSTPISTTAILTAPRTYSARSAIKAISRSPPPPPPPLPSPRSTVNSKSSSPTSPACAAASIQSPPRKKKSPSASAARTRFTGCLSWATPKTFAANPPPAASSTASPQSTAAA